MRLFDGAWLRSEERKGAVAVGGCVATALVLVALNAMAGQLIVSLLLIGLGIPVLLLLTKGLAWTTEIVMVLGMFFAPLNSVRAAGPITIADLLFAMGFVLLAPSVLRRHIEVSQLFVVGWVVLFVMGLLASLAAVNVGISFNHMARLVVAALVLPLAFMVWRPRPCLVVFLAAAYLSGATTSVVYAATLGAGSVRPLGLTTHPNFFGLTAVLGAALVPFVVQYLNPRLRWAVWLAGLICAYGVWVSGSRAAFVALAAIVIVYVVRETSIPMTLGLGLAGAVVLLFLDRIGSGGGSNALSRILGGGSAQGSDYARQQAFDAAVEAIRAHPIRGNGFEHAMEAHSIYLQVWTSVGILGLVGYCLVFLAMIAPLLDPRRPHYRLAYPALTYLLVGIFTNSLWDRFVWAVLALSLLGVVIDNHERGRRVHREPHEVDEADEAVDEADDPAATTGPVLR